MIPPVLFLFVFLKSLGFTTALNAVRSSAPLLFWGEDDSTFNADKSGVLQEGVVKVHLCSEVGSYRDPSAPSAGRPKGARRARSLVSIAFIRK
jgi:hypothetical protein